MASNFEDSLYGLIIGSIVGDIMSHIATVNNQLDTLPKVTSPEDALAMEMDKGEWYINSHLLLSFINLINEGPEDRQSYLKGLMEQATTDVHPSVYMAPVPLYYCNSRDQSMDYLTEDGSDILTKTWISIIDIAIHAVDRKHITSRQCYDDPEIADIISGFNSAPETQKPNNMLEQMYSALLFFKTSSNFVDGMLRLINEISDPTIAAVLYGQLAGAYYGITDIPTDWIEAIKARPFINQTIRKLLRSPAVMHTIKVQAKHNQETLDKENESSFM